MSKDYYNILDVDKGASQDEIKKAFRKKAHIYHPDKQTGDEAKFKEANEAYQVLGNEQKRKQYDQFGAAGMGGQGFGGGQGGFGGFGGQEGMNINMDDLGDMFGDIFGFGGGRSRSRKPSRGEDLQVMLNISFDEAVFGVEKDIEITKNVSCTHCGGEGGEPGSKVSSCKTCNGTGRVVKIQRTILGSMQVEAMCDDCAGEGKTFEQKCTKCRGRGIMMDKVKLTVKIPAGINTGESIRLTGQGEAGESGVQAGDLYIKIRVQESSQFERRDYDIYTKQDIIFTQAVLGDKINIATIHGDIVLKIPEGTQSGTIFKLRNKGVQHLNGRSQGDHLVEININIPKGISKDQKKKLKELNI